MSAASRQRERDRLHLFKRRNHPDWQSFKAWQAEQIKAYDTPEAALGRVEFERLWEISSLLTFPEPDLVTNSEYLVG